MFGDKSAEEAKWGVFLRGCGCNSAPPQGKQRLVRNRRLAGGVGVPIHSRLGTLSFYERMVCTRPRRPRIKISLC